MNHRVEEFFKRIVLAYTVEPVFVDRNRTVSSVLRLVYEFHFSSLFLHTVHSLIRQHSARIWVKINSNL